MRTASYFLLASLCLAGCASTVDNAADTAQALNKCDQDGEGGNCGPTPKPEHFVDTPIPLRCPGRADAALPTPIELPNNLIGSLWGTNKGVLVAYYTPASVIVADPRVEVFGVDVDTHQVVFAAFTSRSKVAPNVGPLQRMAGSLVQHPNCAGDQSAGGAGQVSAGRPPGDPPPTGGGPICGDAPCQCTIDYIVQDAHERACSSY